MKERISYLLMSIVSLFLIAFLPSPGSAQGFVGTWKLDFSKSKHADFFDGWAMVLNIARQSSNKLMIEQTTTTEYTVSKGVTNVDLNGPETASTWPKGDLPVFGYEAVAIGDDQLVRTKAVQGSDKSSFDLTNQLKVVVSQGTQEIVLHSHYELSPNGKTLTVTETRDTRPGRSVVYIFHRVD